jgi:hypothetical protein
MIFPEIGFSPHELGFLKSVRVFPNKEKLQVLISISPSEKEPKPRLQLFHKERRLLSETIVIETNLNEMAFNPAYSQQTYGKQPEAACCFELS